MALSTDEKRHSGDENSSKEYSTNGIKHNIKLDPFKTNAQQNSANDDSSQSIGRFRYLIAILALSSIFLANMNRQAFNQALVRMVRKKESTLPAPDPTVDIVTPPSLDIVIPEDLAKGDYHIKLATPSELDLDLEQAQNLTQDNTTIPISNHVDPLSETETNSDTDEVSYDWDAQQISLLQSAFAYGYMPFMIAGGRLSEIYGAKWVIFLSGFGSAVCSLLTPLLADNSFVLLVASRMLMGICQTGVAPALYALLTRWLPSDESSVYLAMIKVGVMIGFMFASIINGFLPWRIMFVVVGLIGLAWSVMWVILVSSRPEEHKFLSKNELQYIKQRFREETKELEIEDNPNENEDNDGTGEQNNKRKSAPWLSILTNPVVIAFTLTKFTVKLSTDAQSIQLPMYLRRVFNVSHEVNRLLNGANFAIQALFTGVAAYMAKEMIVRKAFGLNKTSVRKLLQGVNNLGMGLGYLMISFNFGSFNIVCFAVMFISVTSMFGSGGEAVLPVDLTTEYSASIMAIANSAANLSGIILPPIVSFILNNDLSSSNRWNLVWCFVGATLIVGGIIFCCFVDASLQDFDAASKRRNKSKSDGGRETISSKKGQTVIEIASSVELKRIKKIEQLTCLKLT